MNSFAVSSIVFAFAFGGALFGMWLRSALPQHHLATDSQDTVKLGIGLVATMTALVLGLVTASAKSSFDAVDAGVKQTATEVLTLDRALARYGPEAGEVRHTLKTVVGARLDTIWPQGDVQPARLDPAYPGALHQAEALSEAIRALKPRDDTQRALQARAVDLSETLLQARWLAVASTESSVPRPFLVVLVFWLTAIFISFGLFAPRNGTVLAVLFVCALSVAGALFLVLEMSSPFDGLMRVSADPLRYAHSHIDR